MRPNGITLSRRHQMTLYGSFGALYVTGIAWYILHDDQAAPFFASDGGNSIAPILLQIHGAAAMAALLVLGSLVPKHITWAWTGRMNRSSGGLMIATQALLVMTGYALYYAGDERLRADASQLHFAIGACFPALLAWHILEGRRRSSEKRATAARVRASLKAALTSADLLSDSTSSDAPTLRQPIRHAQRSTKQ
ncbi:MAG: hypothetical protein JO255_18130 [Alphaproteobacteria bacterium]|nr:hypothetical protein [Hyphomicrobiales bacterium]MBV8653388.1 hypothetical protein [Alphaproteobacteria bacterium]